MLIVQDNKQALLPTEITIAEIWMDVLQIEVINPDDNFFARGGDSLMTMMMLFRVSDVLSVEIPPDILVEAPTLLEFCQAIDNMRSPLDTAYTAYTETGVI